MLSVLVSLLWGEKAINVGVFTGAVAIVSKHNYKREDAKKKAIEKDYIRRIKDEKYPGLDAIVTANRAAISSAIDKIQKATSLDELQDAHNSLLTLLPINLIKDVSFLSYFQKYSGGLVPINTDLGTAQKDLKNRLIAEVGELKGTPNDFFKDSTKNWGDVFGDTTIKAEYSSKITQLATLTSTGADAFQNAIINGTGGFKKLDVNDPYVQRFTRAKDADLAGSSDATRAELQAAGTALVSAWGLKQIQENVSTLLANAALQDANSVNGPITKADAAQKADLDRTPTADDYAPKGSQVTPLTSPTLSDEPGEQDNWETLEGEEKSKRVGIVYGFSAGYEHELPKHALAGFEAFVKKDTMTIKYDLKVKDRAPIFGNLEVKPGYTFGVTVIAGKELNPSLKVFGRGSFEFTRWGFTYTLNNDSPKMANETIMKQELKTWVKQAAIGVGARYAFSPNFGVEVNYDFLPPTKNTIREFKDVGDDKRRRGSVYTMSEHRLFIKVVKSFKI